MAETEALTPWLQAWVDSSSRDDVLGPEWIVIDHGFAARLKTSHERVFELAAADTAFGLEQLTREIPNVDPALLEILDERGLVRVGERVGPGAVLIGKVKPRGGGPASTEEKLLRAIFGETVGEVVDASLRCPPGCFGTVSEAELIEPQAERERARARVTLAWDRPLEVGDVLEIEGGHQVVVAAFDSLEADVAWSGGAGSIRLAKISPARDVIHSRSIGPYSLVTQQPLVGREQFGGQPLTRDQATRLASGAPWALWEMFTIKSDSVDGRVRAYESLVRRENPNSLTGAAAPGPGGVDDLFSFLTPRAHAQREGDVACLRSETAAVLTRELAALGLATRLEAARVGVALHGAAPIRERSHGQVTVPETINYRTLTPERDGLFCQRIFGPVKDYECACGKYKRMKHRGVVCETCGVEVMRSSVRRERFGHIELAVPIIHALFFAEVASLLDLEQAELQRVLASELSLDEDGRPCLDAEVIQTGPMAIAAALGRIDLARLEAGGAEPVQRLAASLIGRGLAPTCFVLEALPVLPPDLRPLVPLDDGRFATSDFNDLYRRVINRNNRNRRLLELDAPIIILNSEASMLQTAVDALLLNERCAKPLTGPNRRALRSLLGSVEGRLATLGSRCVDYSAVARLVADPEVPARACKIPRSIAKELFRPIVYGLLEADGWVTTIKSAKRAVEDEQPYALEAIERASRDYPVLLMGPSTVVARTIMLSDEPVIAVDPDTARLLATLDVRLHLPLTDEAKAECLALADDPQPAEPRASGWLGRMLADSGACFEVLRGAVLDGEQDEVDDPLLRAVFGRAPV